MENASKALIIAGAILLSILLISLGIYIFTQAQTVVNGSGMTQAEVKSFNEQFLKYERTSVKGSEVKSLIQEVNVNNKQDESLERQIELTGVAKEATSGSTSGSTSGDSTSTGGKTYSTSNIKNTKTYTVEIQEYGSDGRITKISITAN